MSDYLKAQDLLDDIRSVKNMRHEKYNFNGYFLGALYHRGHEIICEYIDGRKKINTEDARILEEYIYEMTRDRYGHLDRYGSEAMLRLQKEHGLSRKYRTNRPRWKDKLRASLSPLLHVSVKKTELGTGFKKNLQQKQKMAAGRNHRRRRNLRRQNLAQRKSTPDSGRSVIHRHTRHRNLGFRHSGYGCSRTDANERKYAFANRR